MYSYSRECTCTVQRAIFKFSRVDRSATCTLPCENPGGRMAFPALYDGWHALAKSNPQIKWVSKISGTLTPANTAKDPGPGKSLLFFIYSKSFGTSNARYNTSNKLAWAMPCQSHASEFSRNFFFNCLLDVKNWNFKCFTAQFVKIFLLTLRSLNNNIYVQHNLKYS